MEFLLHFWWLWAILIYMCVAYVCTGISVQRDKQISDKVAGWVFVLAPVTFLLLAMACLADGVNYVGKIFHRARRQ
jgi:hypothetical protein